MLGAREDVIVCWAIVWRRELCAAAVAAVTDGVAIEDLIGWFAIVNHSAYSEERPFPCLCSVCRSSFEYQLRRVVGASAGLGLLVQVTSLLEGWGGIQCGYVAIGTSHGLMSLIWPDSNWLDYYIHLSNLPYALYFGITFILFAHMHAQPTRPLPGQQFHYTY